MADDKDKFEASSLPHGEDLWVFGYGSLIWRPGFLHEERRDALLHGYHRSLCIYSVHHRGDVKRPGLVLGLDRGGACRGAAYRVAARDASQVVAYLRARELVTDVYLERTGSIRLATGEIASALFYIVDRAHPQYAGRLPLEHQTEIVADGVGVSGANPDYVRETVMHLRQMGVHDRPLEAVWSRVEARLSEGRK